MSIPEDARAMKSYIEEHGWIQKRACDSEGRVCLIGALEALTSESHVLDLEQDENSILYAISNFTGYGNCGVVVHWNDTPGRTKEEVLDMLENVAIKYDTDEFRSKGSNAEG